MIRLDYKLAGNSFVNVWRKNFQFENAIAIGSD